MDESGPSREELLSENRRLFLENLELRRLIEGLYRQVNGAVCMIPQDYRKAPVTLANVGVKEGATV